MNLKLFINFGTYFVTSLHKKIIFVEKFKTYMMKTYKFLLLILIGGLLLGWSCNSSTDSNQIDNDSLNNVKNEHTKRVKKIFYNVPSPIEMASIIQKSGAQYKPEILNSYKNTDKYVNVPKQALILGVYGSDLSYVRLFDQIQLSINYLSSIKKLCDELNISEDQGSIAISRMEKNIDKRDSLLQIMSETYSSADAYLKENDRGNTATLIILGGWVEALYICTNIVEFDIPQNKDIINRIGEQKYSLNNLIELINSYPDDNELHKFIPLLAELRGKYDLVGIEYVKEEVVTEKEKKLTTIHSKANVSINKTSFEDIKTTISSIRNKIVNN